MATTQRIIPDGSDGFIEVDWYKDKHRPDRQEKADQTYLLNPLLRECFSNTRTNYASRSNWKTGGISHLYSRQLGRSWRRGAVSVFNTERRA